MEANGILYNKRANELLEFALKTMQSTEWQQVSEKLGTKLYKLKLPDKCDFPCYMTKTTIDQPKDTVVSKLWNVTEQKTKEWDPKLTSWREVERKDNWKVCSQYNEMGTLIWPRHSVFAQVKLEKENTTYLVAFSVDHPSAPTDKKNFVTTKIHMSVYEYVDNGNNTTNVTRVALVDPCGNIPVWLVELFAGNMVNLFNKWKE